MNKRWPVALAAVLAGAAVLQSCASAPSGGGTALQPVTKVAATYPELAGLNGIEGYVLISATIDAAGNVAESRVLTSAPRVIFDDAALEAFDQWKYPRASASADPGIRRTVRQRIRFEAGAGTDALPTDKAAGALTIRTPARGSVTEAERARGLTTSNYIIARLASDAAKTYCAEPAVRVYFANPPLDRSSGARQGQFGCMLAMYQYYYECFDENAVPEVIDVTDQAAAERYMPGVRDCVGNRVGQLNQRIMQELENSPLGGQAR